MSHQWKATPLSKILKPVLRSEKVDPAKEYRLLGIRLDGAGPFLREIKVGSQISANYLSKVKTGDFIYSRLFAWRGAFGVIDNALNECYVSNEFPTYEPISNEIDTQFLKLWFKLPTTISKVESDCSGSTPLTRNRFKEEFFLNLEIALPPPDEQRRIVACIEELATRIEEARELRRRAVAEIQAARDAIFSRLLCHKGPNVVGDFAKIQSGYAFKSEWFSDTGIRLVRNINIGHGQINWHNPVCIPEHRRKEFSRFELSQGDLVISLDRPIISTGVKVARVYAEDIPSLLLQRVGRVYFKTGDVLPDFFFAWLQSPCFIDAIDPGRSNGVPHISPKDIEGISFTPPSIPEQQSIISHIVTVQSKLHALRRHQSETAAALEALLPAVLGRAFRGEL